MPDLYVINKVTRALRFERVALVYYEMSTGNWQLLVAPVMLHRLCHRRRTRGNDHICEFVNVVNPLKGRVVNGYTLPSRSNLHFYF